MERELEACREDVRRLSNRDTEQEALRQLSQAEDEIRRTKMRISELEREASRARDAEGRQMELQEEVRTPAGGTADFLGALFSPRVTHGGTLYLI